MLCEKYGVDMESVDFKAASERFSGMESKEIRGELYVMRDEMNAISSRMAKVLDANRENGGKQHHSIERGSR